MRKSSISSKLVLAAALATMVPGTLDAGCPQYGSCQSWTLTYIGCDPNCYRGPGLPTDGEQAFSEWWCWDEFTLAVCFGGCCGYA